MVDYLAIPSFTGRTQPAVLVRQGERYAYHDDAAPGFVGADISLWEGTEGRSDEGTKCWRLHIYAPGNLCRWIGQKSNDELGMMKDELKPIDSSFILHPSSLSPAGTYTQVEHSAYNVELGQPTVEVIESNAESAEKALDEAAAMELSATYRADIVRGVCRGCEHQGGFPTQYKVRCAKSPASCGCISLLRGVCPESRWVETLVKEGDITSADITQDISVEQMILVINSPFMRWPAGWHRWEVTKEAHRRLLAEAAKRVLPSPHLADAVQVAA